MGSSCQGNDTLHVGSIPTAVLAELPEPPPSLLKASPILSQLRHHPRQLVHREQPHGQAYHIAAHLGELAFHSIHLAFHTIHRQPDRVHRRHPLAKALEVVVDPIQELRVFVEHIFPALDHHHLHQVRHLSKTLLLRSSMTAPASSKPP